MRNVERGMGRLCLQSLFHAPGNGFRPNMLSCPLTDALTTMGKLLGIEEESVVIPEQFGKAFIILAAEHTTTARIIMNKD